jgi:hypothetical protein
MRASGLPAVPFLALELLHGTSLEAHALDLMPPARQRQVTASAQAALEAIHGLGVKHADLNPDNM